MLGETLNEMCYKNSVNEGYFTLSLEFRSVKRIPANAGDPQGRERRIQLEIFDLPSE